ncbi:MAG: YdbH domain-containing protein [Verrucomicrobiota bacterium]|nr:YdbH domain-containing protein [Verrucomicrobiota bacterium]
MSWRARQRRKALLRWVLWLLVLGVLLVAGVIYGLPLLANHFTGNALGKLGFTRHELTFTAVSPWFARVEAVRLDKENMSITVERVSAEFLPWEAAKGRVQAITVEGLAITLTLPDTLAKDDPAPAPFNWDIPVLPKLVLPAERITVVRGALIVNMGTTSLRVPLEGTVSPEKDGLLALLQGRSKTMDLAAKVRLASESTSIAQVSFKLDDTAAALALAHAAAADKWPETLVVSLDPVTLETLAEQSPGAAPIVTAVVETANAHLSAKGAQVDLGKTAAAVRWTWGGQPAFSVGSQVAMTFGDMRVEPCQVTAGLKEGVASASVYQAAFRYGTEAAGVMNLQLQLSQIADWKSAEITADAAISDLRAMGHNFAPLALKVRGQLADFTLQAENVASSALATARFGGVKAQVKGFPEHPQIEATAQALVRLDPAQPAEFPIDAWMAVDLPKGSPPRARFTLGNSADGLNLVLSGMVITGTGGFSMEGALDNNALGGSGECAFPSLSVKAPQGTAVFDQFSGSIRAKTAPLAVWQSLGKAAGNGPAAIIGLLPDVLESFRAEGASLGWNDEASLKGWSVQAQANAAQPGSPTSLSALMSVDALRWNQHTLSHLQADLLYDGAISQVQANGLYGDYSLPWAANATMDAAGTGKFSFASGPVNLNRGLLFVGLVPALNDLELSGRYAVNAEGTFAGKTYAARASVLAENATFRFAKKEITVEGLNADLSLDSIYPLHTDGVRTITFSRVTTGKLDIIDGIIEFRIDDNETMVVSKFEYGFLGGRIMSAPFTVNPAKPTFTLALACIGLDMVEATTLFPQLQVEAAGLLDGVISFRIENGQITPLPGYLELRKGMHGKIRYRKDGWLTEGLDIKSLNFQVNRSVETAFNNFDVESLRIDIKETVGRDVGVTIVSSGSGYGETLKTTVPIGSLTVNTEIPIQDLMELPLLKIFSMIDMGKNE